MPVSLEPLADAYASMHVALACSLTRSRVMTARLHNLAILLVAVALSVDAFMLALCLCAGLGVTLHRLVRQSIPLVSVLAWLALFILLRGVLTPARVAAAARKYDSLSSDTQRFRTMMIRLVLLLMYAVPTIYVLYHGTILVRGV